MDCKPIVGDALLKLITEGSFTIAKITESVIDFMYVNYINCKMNLDLAIQKISSPLNLVITLVTLFGFAYGGYSWYSSIKYAHNLQGSWEFCFVIDSSSKNSYKNMSAGYNIFLSQNNLLVGGKGEKVLVNGEEIPFSQHDRIEFEGRQNDDTLFLTYVLYGQQRKSDGQVVAIIKDDNLLEGRFSGNAAKTKGRVVAKRAI